MQDCPCGLDRDCVCQLHQERIVRMIAGNCCNARSDGTPGLCGRPLGAHPKAYLTDCDPELDIRKATSAAVLITCRVRKSIKRSSGTLINVNGVVYVTTIAHCVYSWTGGVIRSDVQLLTEKGKPIRPIAVQMDPAYYVGKEHLPRAELCHGAAVIHIEQTPELLDVALPLHCGALLPLGTRLCGAGFRQGDLQLAGGTIMRLHRARSVDGSGVEMQYLTNDTAKSGGLSGVGLLHAAQVCGVLQGEWVDEDENDEFSYARARQRQVYTSVIPFSEVNRILEVGVITALPLTKTETTDGASICATTSVALGSGASSALPGSALALAEVRYTAPRNDDMTNFARGRLTAGAIDSNAEPMSLRDNDARSDSESSASDSDDDASRDFAVHEG